MKKNVEQQINKILAFTSHDDQSSMNTGFVQILHLQFNAGLLIKKKLR